MTPWEQMKSKGWDCETTNPSGPFGMVLVGPRVEYGALLVMGEGYTLQEALDKAARKADGL